MTEVNSQGRPKQKRKLKLRSAVWDHFAPSVEGIAQCNHCPSGLNGTHGTKSLWKHLVNHFTTRIDEQGDRKGIVRCNICQREFEAGDDTMENHVKGCIEQDAAAAGTSRPPPPVQSCAPSGSGASSVDAEPAGPEQDEASKDLARMIALGGYDPSVVEDDYFKGFVRRLNPGFEVPSRRAIEEMCDAICDEAKEDFLSRVRDTDSRLSFSLGTAKTFEAGQVLYLASHFIDNQWNLHRMVTDAYVIVDDPFFGGLSLAAKYILSRGLSLAAKYITNGDMLHARELVNKMCHGMDLEGNSEIGPFMTACGMPSLGKHIQEGKVGYFTEPYADHVFHSIAQCFEENGSAYSFDEGKDMDLLTRQKREELLSDRGLEHPMAYDKRWYSVYSMYEAFPPSRTFKGEGISVLGAVYRAIQSISSSRSPTSNLYFVELFKLRKILHSEETKEDIYSDNEDELTEAKIILDEAIQDSYLLWSIPLVLDPRYKLKLIEFEFETSFGSEAKANMISEVIKRMEELYEYYFKRYPDSGRDEINVDSWDDPQEEAGTELGRYLKDSRARSNEAFDILNWWKVHISDYPTVARMARDALAVPTCHKLSSEQTAPDNQ